MKSNITIDRIASIILADDDYRYIYDPEHKNTPPAGYRRTEDGWSNATDEHLNRMKGIETYNPKVDDEAILQRDRADNYNPDARTMKDYSRFKYRGLVLTDEQRADYPPVTITRANGLASTSTFIGGNDTMVSQSEARQINKASQMFLQYAQQNEEKHDNGEEVATYVEDEIPRAIRSGNVNDVKSQSFTFHPSEDVIHNIKFIEFMDKVNPKLADRLLDSSYIAPHEQTPQSLEISKSMHQVDNGDLVYKPRIG